MHIMSERAIEHARNYGQKRFEACSEYCTHPPMLCNYQVLALKPTAFKLSPHSLRPRALPQQAKT
jgi:hypothetical protein